MNKDKELFTITEDYINAINGRKSDSGCVNNRLKEAEDIINTITGFSCCGNYNPLNNYCVKGYKKYDEDIDECETCKKIYDYRKKYNLVVE